MHNYGQQKKRVVLSFSHFVSSPESLFIFGYDCNSKCSILTGSGKLQNRGSIGFSIPRRNDASIVILKGILNTEDHYFQFLLKRKSILLEDETPVEDKPHELTW